MTEFTRKLDGPRATSDFACELALFAGKGQTICLWGDLGAGKTEFARSFIRALGDDETAEVPSPTFSLVQPYEDGRLPVLHFDLYRINGVDEIEELGFFDNEDERITLIEWPDRLGDLIPEERLDIHITGTGDSRNLTLSASGRFAPLPERMVTISKFLRQSGWHTASRKFLMGDASARRYERLRQSDGKTAILMDMPQTTDGPVIRNGKPYSQLAHLAEGVRCVHAINKQLREKGFMAPCEYAKDLGNGLMLIEDFGDKVFGELYLDPQIAQTVQEAAVDLLAQIAQQDWPHIITLDDNSEYHLKSYDQQVIETEITLLTDWFWPWASGQQLCDASVEEFFAIWRRLIPFTQLDEPKWVLRDFHSPNLIWLEKNTGTARVGLIDTQDSLLGHPAYDLAAMLQDARTDITDDVEAHLMRRYCKNRSAAGNFDEAGFKTAYAVLGTQRASKILGIFARLKKRDGKSQYLKHIPRVLAYLDKNLEHPQLAELKDWFRDNLGDDIRASVQEKTR